jgi:murein DD-endopeptidase MepM/ murein hydrolase activator NlpD
MIYPLKQKTNNNKKIIVGLLLASLIFVFGVNPTVVGQSADELTKMKQEKQRKLDEVNKRIADLQGEIKQRRSIANSLNNEIAILNLEIAETEAQIEATTQKIDATNLEIADITNQIIETEADIKTQKLVLKGLIGQINDLDQLSPLEIALENDNFTEFLDQLQYTTSIQERSQEALTQIKILKLSLETKNAELKKQRADLDTLRDQLEIAEANLNGQRVAKQDFLTKTRSQEKQFQKLLTESESLEDQIQKEIYDLEVELRKKLGNNRLPPKKGLFMWPMEGTLTQGYGNTGFTKLGYNFHNGLDIAAPAGRTIYVVHDGLVEDTGTGQGAYGNWVTIRHTVSGGRQLITLYAHMSSFKLKKGQSVKTGDVVGFEGNTGNTTRLLYGPHRGYHLHFTVFDASGYGVSKGTIKQYGTYYVPYGATYNPNDFL